MLSAETFLGVHGFFDPSMEYVTPTSIIEGWSGIVSGQVDRGCQDPEEAFATRAKERPLIAPLL